MSRSLKKRNQFSAHVFGIIAPAGELALCRYISQRRPLMISFLKIIVNILSRAGSSLPAAGCATFEIYIFQQESIYYLLPNRNHGALDRAPASPILHPNAHHAIPLDQKLRHPGLPLHHALRQPPRSETPCPKPSVVSRSNDYPADCGSAGPHGRRSSGVSREIPVYRSGA